MLLREKRMTCTLATSTMTPWWRYGEGGLFVLNNAHWSHIHQELEGDPEFQRIIRTGYAQRPPLPVSAQLKWLLASCAILLR